MAHWTKVFGSASVRAMDGSTVRAMLEKGPVGGEVELFA